MTYLSVAAVIVLFSSIANAQMPTRANLLDAVIESHEREFTKFGASLRERVQKLENPIQREGLLAPFEIMAANKTNPRKNIQREIENITFGESLTTSVEDVRHFFYGILPDEMQSRAVAAYSPISKTVLLPLTVSTGSLCQNLYLYHELFHVGQDIDWRQRIASEEEYSEYLAFYRTSSIGHRGRLILNYETSAFAAELEVIDILVDGAFRIRVLEGKVVDDQWLTSRLGNIGCSINDVLKLGIPYFSTPFSDRTMPKEFVFALAASYEALGELFFLSTSGLRPITAIDIQREISQ